MSHVTLHAKMRLLVCFSTTVLNIRERRIDNDEVERTRENALVKIRSRLHQYKSCKAKLFYIFKAFNRATTVDLKVKPGMIRRCPWQKFRVFS